MKIIRSYMLILVLCVALVSVCAGGAAEEALLAKGSNYDLCVGSTTEMSGNFFTDMWGNNAADMDVRFLLHGYGLMYWDNLIGGYQPDPNVVSGMIVTDDPNGNRTYTLAINHELCYSDGTPINAKDYVFSILLQISPEVRALGAQTYGSDYIIGAAEYKSGAADRLKGVHLIDDNHFSVTVKAEYYPNFYELSLLDYYPYPIFVLAPGCEITSNEEGVAIENADKTLDEDIFTAELLKETIFNEETGYMTHPSVVSGPYTLTSFDGTTAFFEVNHQYKGNAAAIMPMIPRMAMTLAENDTMVEALSSGKLTLLNRCMDSEAVQKGLELLDGGKFGATGYARDGLCCINFCCEQLTVADNAVRQAIAMCLDKDAFIESTIGMTGRRVDGFFGLGQWTYQMVNGTDDLFTDDPAVVIGDAELKGVEKDPAVWNDLTLDGIKIYDFDVAAATELLEADGWTLNTAGKTFDAKNDAVRCKEMDGIIVPLNLTLVYPEGNAAGENLQSTFVENLAKAGIQLTLEARPMPELLELLYRQQERSCDMIYVAMNFSPFADQSAMFSMSEEDQGIVNVTGIKDEALYESALAMNRVQPGDLAEYCKRWIAFEEQWTETLPAIPLYSNVYYDFYTARLQDYAVAANVSWAQAIVPSYMSDEMP